MTFETSAISLQGNRDINQDRCSVLQDKGCILLLLSDGMGGHPRGEVAAQFLVDAGRAAFQSVTKPIKDPAGFLDDIVKSAHENVLAYGQAQRPPIAPRATAVAVLVQDASAYWCHVGDSRFYLFRGYRVSQRTKDHSVVQRMQDQGVISRGDNKAQRYRNLVTHCIGGSHSSFKTSRGRLTELHARDILLLCTDGLWGQVSDQELCARLRHHGSLERMVHELAHVAEQNAAPSSDNVTLLVLRWETDQLDQGVTAQTPIGAAENHGEEDLRDAIDQLRSAIEEFESDT